MDKTEKRVGKIQSVSFGFGGYQDAQFGLSVSLGSDKECWGVGDFRGMWTTEWSKHCKWSEADRDAEFAKTVRWTWRLLADAKKKDVSKLVGTPVMVEFKGNTLKSWRVLTEAI